MKPRIGFIGLGIMGSHMAIHLINAGYDLIVYDILSEKIDSVVAKGAAAGHHREMSQHKLMLLSPWCLILQMLRW